MNEEKITFTEQKRFLKRVFKKKRRKNGYWKKRVHEKKKEDVEAWEEDEDEEETKNKRESVGLNIYKRIMFLPCRLR